MKIEQQQYGSAGLRVSQARIGGTDVTHRLDANGGNVYSASGVVARFYPGEVFWEARFNVVQARADGVGFVEMAVVARYEDTERDTVMLASRQDGGDQTESDIESPGNFGDTYVFDAPGEIIYRVDEYGSPAGGVYDAYVVLCTPGIVQI